MRQAIHTLAARSLPLAHPEYLVRVSRPRVDLVGLRERPWSTSSLKRLGAAVRDGTPAPEDRPEYDEVIEWFGEVVSCVLEQLGALELGAIAGVSGPLAISGRVKTLGTLREKLQRDPSTPLTSVQDVAGVRVEGEMSLEAQDRVATAVAEAFGGDRSWINDLRTRPHSGYRAVHVRLRLPRHGMTRVEVQVRTHLQGEWANFYEALADVVGRGIRYGEAPSDREVARLVSQVQAISVDGVAELEKLKQELVEYRTLLQQMPKPLVRIALALVRPSLRKRAARRGFEPTVDGISQMSERVSELERNLSRRLRAETDQLRLKRGEGA